ncbi:hypothetical protein EB796_011096 [Bugula neritina]|uniref:Uncharacterized protein n=1 Tax=Bugula neritina TaxID=10212 RepID=A0A7J7JW06_BUGNE|nr:hypothetical protein EB796_011096 [Bugula neritina]
MQSKHKGSVIQQLSDCCYTVEFTSAEDAKKVLEQEMLQYKENKILVRSYDSFVEESTTPALASLIIVLW